MTIAQFFIIQVALPADAQPKLDSSNAPDFNSASAALNPVVQPCPDVDLSTQLIAPDYCLNEVMSRMKPPTYWAEFPEAKEIFIKQIKTRVCENLNKKPNKQMLDCALNLTKEMTETSIGKDAYFDQTTVFDAVWNSCAAAKGSEIAQLIACAAPLVKNFRADPERAARYCLRAIQEGYGENYSQCSLRLLKETHLFKLKGCQMPSFVREPKRLIDELNDRAADLSFCLEAKGAREFQDCTVNLFSAGMTADLDLQTNEDCKYMLSQLKFRYPAEYDQFMKNYRPEKTGAPAAEACLKHPTNHFQECMIKKIKIQSSKAKGKSLRPAFYEQMTKECSK